MLSQSQGIVNTEQKPRADTDIPKGVQPSAACVFVYVCELMTVSLGRLCVQACMLRSPLCVSVDLSLDGEQRRNKFRNSKQTVTELKSNKRVLTDSTVQRSGGKERDCQTKKESEKEKERGWAAS